MKFNKKCFPLILILIIINPLMLQASTNLNSICDLTVIEKIEPVEVKRKPDWIRLAATQSIKAWELVDIHGIDIPGKWVEKKIIGGEVKEFSVYLIFQGWLEQLSSKERETILQTIYLPQIFLAEVESLKTGEKELVTFQSYIENKNDGLVIDQETSSNLDLGKFASAFDLILILDFIIGNSDRPLILTKDAGKASILIPNILLDISSRLALIDLGDAMDSTMGTDIEKWFELTSDDVGDDIARNVYLSLGSLGINTSQWLTQAENLLGDDFSIAKLIVHLKAVVNRNRSLVESMQKIIPQIELLPKVPIANSSSTDPIRMANQQSVDDLKVRLNYLIGLLDN